MAVTSDLANQRSRRVDAGVTSSLIVAALAAITFILVAALPYFVSDTHYAAEFAGRRGWLMVHICVGMVAILVGPLQLWLGFHGLTNTLHRALGKLYVVMVVLPRDSLEVIAPHLVSAPLAMFSSSK